MTEKTVTITQEQFDRLVADASFLDALEALGVDNWDGYGDARRMVDDFFDPEAEATLWVQS